MSYLVKLGQLPGDIHDIVFPRSGNIMNMGSIYNPVFTSMKANNCIIIHNKLLHEHSPTSVKISKLIIQIQSN